MSRSVELRRSAVCVEISHSDVDGRVNWELLLPGGDSVFSYSKDELLSWLRCAAELVDACDDVDGVMVHEYGEIYRERD